MTVVFHYTYADLLAAIWAAQVLVRSRGDVAQRMRPAVWLSTNPYWEPSVERRDDRGLVRPYTSAKPPQRLRIEVAPEAAPYTWDDYVRLCGGPSTGTALLAHRARDCHADVSEWRVSFAPILDTCWLGVCVWVEDRWVSWEPTLWSPGEGVRVERREAPHDATGHQQVGHQDECGFIQRLARMKHALARSEEVASLPGETQARRTCALMLDLQRLHVADGWLLFEGDTRFGPLSWLEYDRWVAVPQVPENDGESHIRMWPRDDWYSTAEVIDEALNADWADGRLSLEGGPPAPGAGRDRGDEDAEVASSSIAGGPATERVVNGAFGGSSGGVMTRDEQIAVVKAAFVAHCVQGIDGPLYEREGLWFEPLENWNLGVQWAVDGRWLASGLSWRIEASNHPIRTNYRRSGERGFEPGSRWIAEQIDITFSLEAVFSAEVLPRFLEVLPAAGFHDCLLTAEAVACLLTGRVRILLDVLAEHPSEAGPTVPIAERRAVGVAAASRSLDLPEDHCGWPIAVACVSRTALDRPLADSLREALEALMHLDRELGSARAGAPLAPHAASDRPARRPHATRPASEPAVGPPPSPPERTPVDRLLAVAEEDLLARFGPLRRIMHVPGGARPTGGELIRDHEGRYPYALPDYDDWYVHGVDHIDEGQAWGPAQKDVLWDRGLIAGTPVRPDFEDEETRQWLRAMSPSIFKSRAVWIERNADWLGCVVQDSPRACGSVLAYKLGIGTSRSAPLGGLDADQSSLVCWAQFAATIELARFGALETLVGALNASPLCHGTGRSSADAAFHIGPVWDSPELIDASWDNMYRLPPFAGRVSGDDHWPPAGRPRRPFGALTAMAEFVAPTGAERQSFASFLDSFLARFLCAEQSLLTALLPERE